MPVIDFQEEIKRVSAIHNTLPLWVRAAYSLSFYRPEAIVHLLWDDWGTQLGQPEVVEQDRMFVYCWAAHQIHRFGAGPALRPDIMESLRQKAMAYPEYLESGLLTSPKKIAGTDYRGMNLCILDADLYVETALAKSHKKNRCTVPQTIGV